MSPISRHVLRTGFGAVVVTVLICVTGTGGWREYQRLQSKKMQISQRIHRLVAITVAVEVFLIVVVAVGVKKQEHALLILELNAVFIEASSSAEVF